MVAEASIGEDMRTVTVPQLQSSRRIFIAADEAGFAGHLRELPRTFVDLSSHGRDLFVSELGSMWVHPLYRGQGIARRLVAAATETVLADGHIPMAVCNTDGRHTFERAGYHCVGSLPVDKKDRRAVMLHEPGDDRLRKDWHQLRTKVAANLRVLPRFQALTLHAT